jgi:hypothetical protein
MVYFGRPWNGKVWLVLWPFGILMLRLVYFMAYWHFVVKFYILFLVLFCSTKINLATLLAMQTVTQIKKYCNMKA